MVASYMQAPMDLMINTVTRNSSLLSCNKAIEKSGSASKEVIDLLKRILAATEIDENRAKEPSQICDDVFASLPIGFAEVRKTLQSKVQGFQKAQGGFGQGAG